MNRVFLFVCACLFSCMAHAQQPDNSGVHNDIDAAHATVPMANNQATAVSVSPHSGAKTTLGGSRWYKFADHMLAPYQAYVSKGTFNYGYSLWNDTTAWIGYLGGPSIYSRSENLSMAMGLDPTYMSSIVSGYGWNAHGSGAVTNFSGGMGITATDAYVIDSVIIPGWYTRTYATSAKRAVIDTLILSFVVSPRSGTSIDLPVTTISSPPAPYGVASISYRDLYHDIANNRGAHNGGGALSSYVYKFQMGSTDTNSNSYSTLCQYPRHAPDPMIYVPVPANYIMAMTATFKTGDTSYRPSDTIRYSNGTIITGYKYNLYAADVAFATSTMTPSSPADVTWPFYDTSNQSCGYFLFASGAWGAPGNKYAPQWSIFNGTTSAPAPSIAQYPRFGYHVSCGTCTTTDFVPFTLGTENAHSVSNVVVAPNPANNELNISFTAVHAGATVMLINSFGQQVASQVVSNGHAAFNTASLAEGVYIYTIDTKDGKSSGRVVIAH